MHVGEAALLPGASQTELWSLNNTYEKTPTEEEAEPDVSAPAHKGLLYGMMQSNQVHDVSNLTEKCGLNYIYLSCSHVLNLISLPQE